MAAAVDIAVVGIPDFDMAFGIVVAVAVVDKVVGIVENSVASVNL